VIREGAWVIRGKADKIQNASRSSIKRVRARLVRRLIWVEELLCSNHNNPIKIKV